jgi:hypothetical protein
MEFNKGIYGSHGISENGKGLSAAVIDGEGEKKD